MKEIIFLGTGLMLFTLFIIFIAFFVKGKEEITPEDRANQSLANYGKFESDRGTRIGDYAKYLINTEYKGWRDENKP